ncbi:MAG TPA: UvrD-helicase domain-containing protein [Patescibacteria group bacterium]|nr:UvrD-helicase domain-containing protein [Patescibacteria group bacterium]
MTDSLLKNLNKFQKEAVTYEGGHLLVLAGAGSGKTRVLTFRTAWLIDSKKVRPENILLLTFTNKAAGEMKERVAKLTSQKPSFAGTFHSFCAKVLRIDGQALGIPKDFIIYDDEDTKEAIKEILDNLNLPVDSYKPPVIASQISDAKNNMLTPSQFAEFIRSEFQEKVFKIYMEYEKLLQKIGALDFDDLLLKTVSLFDKDINVLSKWQDSLTHILVDEWQDTNKIQYKLTKQLVGNRGNITAVGDASQSIYMWRGADYRNINHLMRDFPKIKIVNLEQNYRSTQNILSAANSVISKNTSHPILNLWTQNDIGEKINLYSARSGLDEASYVVNEILNLTQNCINKYSYKNIAVLYRTNAQSRVLEEAFLHAGIPYTIVGGVHFYSRTEIKDVLSYLRLLSNPKDVVSRKRIQKMGVRRYQKFENFAKDFTKEYLTTLDILDSVLKETGYLDKYQKETEENMTRLENIKELRSVATEFPDINDFLENVALVEAEQTSDKKIHSINYNQERNNIILMTIHAAKGLEFPIIFIVGMEEGLFPHSRSLMDISQLEEERRLAYVGITRAKDKLYLSYASRRLYFGENVSNPPSRFLIDIPEDLIQGANELKFKKEEKLSDPDSGFDWIVEKYLGKKDVK